MSTLFLCLVQFVDIIYKLLQRPFTRAQGNVKKGVKEEKITTPRPATSMVTCDGDVIVYKGKCKLVILQSY